MASSWFFPSRNLPLVFLFVYYTQHFTKHNIQNQTPPLLFLFLSYTQYITQHNIHNQLSPLLFLFLSYTQHITKHNIHNQHLPLLFLCLSYKQHITLRNTQNQNLPLIFLFLSYIQQLPPTTRHKTICATHVTRHEAPTDPDQCSRCSRTVPNFSEVPCPTPEEVFDSFRSLNV